MNNTELETKEEVVAEEGLTANSVPTTTQDPGSPQSPGQHPTPHPSRDEISPSVSERILQFLQESSEVAKKQAETIDNLKSQLSELGSLVDDVKQKVDETAPMIIKSFDYEEEAKRTLTKDDAENRGRAVLEELKKAYKFSI